jgi:hypothetical protein
MYIYTNSKLYVEDHKAYILFPRNEKQENGLYVAPVALAIFVTSVLVFTAMVGLSAPLLQHKL